MTAVGTQALIRDLVAHPATRVKIFLELPIEKQAVIILAVSKKVREHIVKKIDQTSLVALLEQLDPDEATDVIQLLSVAKQKEVAAGLQDHLKESVSLLLQFPPDTAAGLMNVDYIQVDADDTLEKVITQLEKHESRTGKLPTILVLEAGELMGILPIKAFIGRKNTSTVKQHIKKIPTIKHTANSQTVLQKLRSNPHSKMVVLNENNSVLGVIYPGDILRILQEEQNTSLYNFAGVSDEETISDSAQRKIASRYKWLVINLATAFLASFTVSLFNETISRNVLLAVYMPIVAGMGGNAGTQTLAVMVRGLASAQPTSEMILRTLRNEVIAGSVNGLLNGVIVTAIVYLFNNNLRVGLILGFAMITNLVVSSTFGTLVPVLMKKLGKDPAASATIFITTATDVLGFLAFLGLATLLL